MNEISFISLDNFEAPETDRTTFTNGQRYSNNLPYVAAAPLYNPQYINLDTVAQSVGMFIMSLDITKYLIFYHVQIVYYIVNYIKMFVYRKCCQ